MTHLRGLRSRQGGGQHDLARYSIKSIVLSTPPGTGGASPYLVAPQGITTVKLPSGATDTSFVGTVTASLVVLTGAPVLSGTTTKAATAGVADFTGNGMTVTGVGTWRLAYAAPTYGSVSSAVGTTT